MSLKQNYLTFFIFMMFISCGAKDVQTETVLSENTENEDGQDSEAVSKENGGIGFEEIADSEGWESNPDYVGYALKEAIKGGDFLDSNTEGPGTYRPEGINSNTTVVASVTDYAYMGLIKLDTLTNEYYPSMATHWKNEIVDGKQIAHFRINPEARWWDGTEVTADDVIATFEFLKDEGIQYSYTNQFSSYYEIEKISKYIIKVTIQDLDWKKFYNFGRYHIYPASHLSKIDGATFLEKYNRNQLMGSGPYKLSLDTKEGENYILEKVENWWGHKALPYTKNMYNFDRVVYEIVADENLIKENFKLGKYSIYSNITSGEWFDEFGLEIDNVLPALTNNVMKKKVVFNYLPKNKRYIAFNQRKPILDDKRFREAVMHLWNRDLMIEKLFRNDMVKSHSYWPLGKYSDSNPTEYNFDPEKANALLDEMGYTERDSDGTRMNAEGIKLEFNVPSRNYSSWIQMYVLFQSDLKAGGIKINLNPIDFAEWVKSVTSREFDITIESFTTDIFPDPRLSLHSDMAEGIGTDNDSGIKDPNIDNLIDAYDAELDLNKQPGYLQQIDKILNDEVYFGFAYANPYSSRFIYWDIFAYPDTMGSNVSVSPTSYWWIDPDKKSQVDKFLGGDITVTMDAESLIVDPWNIKPKDYDPKG